MIYSVVEAQALRGKSFGFHPKVSFARSILCAMDILTQAQRSERMSRIRSRNTTPELAIRSLVHRMGYRFRLHDAKLPGKPDMVFSAHKKVIFFHGCFWHGHTATHCKIAHLPKSRQEFWLPKLQSNRLRDRRVRRQLKKMGWQSLVVWECEFSKHPVRIASRIALFLG